MPNLHTFCAFQQKKAQSCWCDKTLGFEGSSAEMKAYISYPITKELLNCLETAKAKQRLIGERLYCKVAVVQPKLAGKITGMLLELDNDRLLQLLRDNKALYSIIDEAIAILKEHYKACPISIVNICKKTHYIAT